jgi:Protein of unknown function (DUF3311)
MQPPSIGAIALGAVPFAGACLSVSLWDRIHPFVLGLPFNFFWLILWLLLTPVCIWGAYLWERSRPPESDPDGQN